MKTENIVRIIIVRIIILIALIAFLVGMTINNLNNANGMRNKFCMNKNGEKFIDENDILSQVHKGILIQCGTSIYHVCNTYSYDKWGDVKDVIGYAECD